MGSVWMGVPMPTMMSFPPGLVAFRYVSAKSMAIDDPATYVESCLHANLLACAVKGHIGAFKVGVVQRSDLHHIFGQILRNHQFFGRLREMFSRMDNIALVRKAIGESIVDAPAINVGNDNCRSTRHLSHGCRQQAHGSCTKDDRSVALLDGCSAGCMNRNRQRFQ